MANIRADLVAGPEAIQLHPNAHRFEIGNFNLPAIHSVGGALDLISSIGLPAISDHLLSLSNQFIEHLDRLDIELVGPRERERRSHIYVLDLHGGGWAAFLAEAGVRPSQVRGGLRVSFGIYNTSDDVDRLANILARGQRTARPLA